MSERFVEALGTSSVITEGANVGAHNSLRYEIVVASWYFYAAKNEFELILNSMSGLSCQIVQFWIIWKTTADDAERKRNRHGLLQKVKSWS